MLYNVSQLIVICRNYQNWEGGIVLLDTDISNQLVHVRLIVTIKRKILLSRRTTDDVDGKRWQTLPKRGADKGGSPSVRRGFHKTPFNERANEAKKDRDP